MRIIALPLRSRLSPSLHSCSFLLRLKRIDKVIQPTFRMHATSDETSINDLLAAGEIMIV